ncbi:DUF349 domain-containing protein [Mycetocola miduiensis]|uniref:DUF349 domain-containing protein n=1 Tax=Mycetocola miduiensis TaxID=995034 RepID=A0A1I5CL84_9MICO|nr:DUF349 domain-containing protein [Mycetocola miduiensis]SFN87646.1 protein of unknown function [Mycetocola miduiensis]
MSNSEQQPWGRVDESGAVFVREGDDWREVGQYPDGTAEEALAYFERKYVDLAGQVTLLEQRVKRGAPAADVATAVARLAKNLDGANAVGDLEGLKARVAALDTTVGELTEQQGEEAKAAVAEALAVRTAIVQEAEKLAAQDPAKAQWKNTTEQINALFAQWQTHQQEGPKLPKGEANDLWKRFRSAKSTIEQNRRAFFAELDTVHRDAKSRKQALIEKAEALVEKGVDGIPGYRALLDEWKQSGRAGKRHDDALWARFKAAGDAIYAAKSEVDARDNAEFQGNLEAKLALLEEAEPLLAETDRDKVRSTLADIQRRWDDIGKVPRDQVKNVEDRLRKVEQHLRTMDDDHWKRNNPETKARTEGLAGQLNAAIAKLEHELQEAKASGDQARITEATDALEARKLWLNALS